MTWLSKLLSLFPSLIIGFSGVCALWLFVASSRIEALIRLILLCFVLYGLPLLTYRLHSRFHPVTEGISYLQSSEYSPWWGSHQIQLIYIAFPALETLLRLVPGLFSFWLRLWGSSIGQRVYWAPGLEIADRGLLTVGDRAIIGHRVGLYAHVIKPKRQDLLLYIKRICIGENAFIGSASRLGPGVAIADNTFLPVTTDLFPNQQSSQQGNQPTTDPCENASPAAG